MLKFITYSEDKKQDLKDVICYLQTKGSKLGNPMNEPTANSIAVLNLVPEQLYTKYAYYVILYAYQRGMFKAHEKGSVIPFITMQSAKEVVKKAFEQTCHG